MRATSWEFDSPLRHQKNTRVESSSFQPFLFGLAVLFVKIFLAVLAITSCQTLAFSLNTLPPHRAEVVELVDTLGSGSSEGNLVGVRLSPSAPEYKRSDFNVAPLFRISAPKEKTAVLCSSFPLQNSPRRKGRRRTKSPQNPTKIWGPRPTV